MKMVLARILERSSYKVGIFANINILGISLTTLSISIYIRIIIQNIAKINQFFCYRLLPTYYQRKFVFYIFTRRENYCE